MNARYVDKTKQTVRSMPLTMQETDRRLFNKLKR